LRFWWRATRGGQFEGSLLQMKAAEDKLWGAASTPKAPRPSHVHVVVEVLDAGQPDRPFEVIPGNPGYDGRPRPRVRYRASSKAPAYGAFPLQPAEREAQIGMETRAVRVGVRFRLTIVYPNNLSQDIAAALWAWEHFGGVGARTRRGFGALVCETVDGAAVALPTAAAAGDALTHGLRSHVVAEPWPDGVPHLSSDPAWLVTVPEATIERAWGNALQDLKDFRQQRNPGQQPNRPGRSRWPEPDEIRARMRRAAPEHGRRIVAVSKFPRAAFGLPIITHFKDRGDPEDTTLQGAHHDRLASPLILRPVACQQGRAVGLAAVLAAPRTPPGGIVLKGRSDRVSAVQTTLTPAEAAALTDAHGQPLLGGETDVLKAFLAFVRGR
jgi:CRISPR-associated protein Cmr1